MRDTLYPAIEPFASGFLKVSEQHELYYEQVGNPKGRPVVFLHGGPGGGLSPEYRLFFDPKHYHVILLDQRGAGKSRPTAEIEENTTWDLVTDIETLRKKLEIDRWIVFGGSWGSTLALVYAETHPDRVEALVLRGIFMCRKQEIDWFYQEGTSRIFPDAFLPYRNHIPEGEQHDLVAAYYKRLTSPDKNVQFEAARHWSVWEGATSKLIPEPDFIQKFNRPEFALAFARIECHYFTHRIFLETDSWILDNANKIAHIPTDIIHGRYDVVCPVENAFDLKAKLPIARLEIIPNAGHSAFEPPIAAALVRAMERLKNFTR
jgi:proline iminopeptidase